MRLAPVLVARMSSMCGGAQGKRPYEFEHPEVWPALEKLVDPVTRGDPESPLRWTCKSTVVLSGELFKQHGIESATRQWPSCFASMVTASKRPTSPSRARSNPDRDAQFEYINAKAQDGVDRNIPVIFRRYQKKGACRKFQKRRTRVAAEG